MTSFYEWVKLLTDSNLNISVDPIFRKLHDKFMAKKTDKNYKNLVIYLRTISDKNTLEFGQNSLLFADDDNVVVFNSTFPEDINSFENYSNGLIPYDNKIQKKCTKKSKSRTINIIHKENHGKLKYMYVSNLIGSTCTISVVNKD